MRFRKKPVVIEAIQWLGGDYKALQDFCGPNWSRADAAGVTWNLPSDKEEVVLWNTAEHQWIQCPVGHWIIRGVKGEIYPCESQIFALTYEEVKP